MLDFFVVVNQLFSWEHPAKEPATVAAMSVWTVLCLAGDPFVFPLFLGLGLIGMLVRHKLKKDNNSSVDFLGVLAVEDEEEEDVVDEEVEKVCVG